MHAFIDEGNYSNMTIDTALRQMLKDFKLPGVWPAATHHCMHVLNRATLQQSARNALLFELVVCSSHAQHGICVCACVCV